MAILYIIPMAEVYHVGSTAIKNCQAKPIIDISMFSLDENVVQNLGSIGYDIRKIPDLACDFICVKRLPFSFNLHLFFTKNQGFYDLLNFCNYLNLNPDGAARYEF